ncbi:hypothetical protein M2262_003968 [Pseudomonas sp. BIGb0408]|uniref:Uncharacterized protein n=1 Tax=Phytopseudomonas flavescens TaxID=29435 RepID=A0A7Z0BLK6_9GAMM|nr:MULTISPECIES: hypothetical protein [Pseudomonas]MCW2293918.1 hypothetical protein [Pseudomonas sp. BIGb0408]NYH71512.1 hypothetical protein [Pseudomonas flavescens]
MSIVTFRPRASRIAAKDAEAMPFPNEETTPPVTKMKRVMKNPKKSAVAVEPPGSREGLGSP